MKQVITILRQGGVGVLPTDTLYGIVGSALSPEAVRRTYRLRRRNLKKPMIVLIGDSKDLKRFNIRISPPVKKILNRVWPGKISIVLPLPKNKNILKKFKYLHRGSGTIAFRLPRSARLRSLLRQTGPLVAPSANFEGEPASKTIRAARSYFDERADFYVDAGRLDSKPSTIIGFDRGEIKVIRKGAADISNLYGKLSNNAL